MGRLRMWICGTILNGLSDLVTNPLKGKGKNKRDTEKVLFSKECFFSFPLDFPGK